MDRDRFNLTKLPDGMSHGRVSRLLAEAASRLQSAGVLSDDMAVALRYAETLVINEQLNAFHSSIPQRRR